MTLNYPEGIDCVWMSVDKNGHVAAFVTGGEGPIPVDVLNQDFFPIEDIESAICELDVTSEAKLLVSLPRPDDFIELQATEGAEAAIPQRFANRITER